VRHATGQSASARLLLTPAVYEVDRRRAKPHVRASDDWQHLVPMLPMCWCDRLANRGFPSGSAWLIHSAREGQLSQLHQRIRRLPMTG